MVWSTAKRPKALIGRWQKGLGWREELPFEYVHIALLADLYEKHILADAAPVFARPGEWLVDAPGLGLPDLDAGRGMAVRVRLVRLRRRGLAEVVSRVASLRVDR